MANNKDDDLDPEFAEIIKKFNEKLKAEGKTFEDLDAENEAKQKAIAEEYANDPELQAIWAEAEAEAEADADADAEDDE